MEKGVGGGAQKGVEEGVGEETGEGIMIGLKGL